VALPLAPVLARDPLAAVPRGAQDLGVHLRSQQGVGLVGWCGAGGLVWGWWAGVGLVGWCGAGGLVGWCGLVGWWWRLRLGWRAGGTNTCCVWFGHGCGRGLGSYKQHGRAGRQQATSSAWGP
jgi:hypothetical protein